VSVALDVAEAIDREQQAATAAINGISIGARHRRDMGDLRALANSIAELGLLQPIGVSPAEELVFGERRLRACRDILGWDAIAARIVNVSSICEGAIHENTTRACPRAPTLAQAGRLL
jgi:hypothetical protein